MLSYFSSDCELHDRAMVIVETATGKGNSRLHYKSWSTLSVYATMDNISTTDTKTELVHFKL